MNKACDRCGKPVNKYGIVFKFRGLFKKFTNNIDEVIIQRREGELHPEYHNYEFYGKMDLCEECTENFEEWMNQGK